MAADPPPPPLEPIVLPVFREEGFGDKFLRKTRENPLVPLGEGRVGSGGVWLREGEGSAGSGGTSQAGSAQVRGEA